MLGIRWHARPIESGSHLRGSRFNPKGVPALYLSADHPTAIAEYHQFGPRAGTLIAYDVQPKRIVDLTDARTCIRIGCSADELGCRWADMAMNGETPPTWTLVDRLIAGGADGAIVPSFQRRSGTNIVLWRWHEAGTAGDGAAIDVIDPEGDLRRR